MANLRFAYLGSGSKGNAALVRAQNTVLMVDCGFSVTEAEKRLARLDVGAEEVTALLVTHEHGDHLNGVARFARRYKLPVWMTRGTYRVWKDQNVPAVEFFHAHEHFKIGDIRINPYPVPHDACEPCQFTFEYEGRKLGVLSDVGTVTPHICEQLDACDALMIECNHDPEMLRMGPYSPSLKQRVAGPLGHLSNEQTAGLLERIDLTRLQHLVIAHMSETNNSPALARQAVIGALGMEPEWLEVAPQNDVLGWKEIA